MRCSRSLSWLSTDWGRDDDRDAASDWGRDVLAVSMRDWGRDAVSDADGVQGTVRDGRSVAGGSSSDDSSSDQGT
jgi:hypothetical protein